MISTLRTPLLLLVLLLAAACSSPSAPELPSSPETVRTSGSPAPTLEKKHLGGCGYVRCKRRGGR